MFELCRAKEKCAQRIKIFSNQPNPQITRNIKTISNYFIHFLILFTMNKLKFFAALCCAALLLVACDKDDETKTPEQTPVKTSGVFTCDIDKEFASVADVWFVTPSGKEVKITESNRSVSLTEEYTEFPFTGKIVLKQSLRNDVTPDADKMYNLNYTWSAKIHSLDKNDGIISFKEGGEEVETTVEGANLKNYFTACGELEILVLSIDKNGNVEIK